ncbi:hypothetical protein HAX54_038409, partial [Datura stramonium]|nr:hypothetical protein [Datura stramonium]
VIKMKKLKLEPKFGTSILVQNITERVVVRPEDWFSPIVKTIADNRGATGKQSQGLRLNLRLIWSHHELFSDSLGPRIGKTETLEHELQHESLDHQTTHCVARP